MTAGAPARPAVMKDTSMATVHAEDLRTVLERIYRRYNRRWFVESDPLRFAYRYSDARDVEVVAFLAAGLAYGRVQQIHKSLDGLFAIIGKSPYDFVLSFSSGGRRRLSGFKHRFTRGDDIADLLQLLRDVLREHGSLQSFFLAGCERAQPNVLPALARFCDTLCSRYAAQHGGHVSRGLMYLLASPSRGSAGKRLNLFLRWMVRDDAVDLGLWPGVDKAKLIVPVDVHMGRLCRFLGLYDGRTVNLSTALQITRAFAGIEAADPVKYDFALSRIGIVENCNGHYRTECELCELAGPCLQRRK
jgi:uncharacterized protein (TIGR02757 family)